MAAGRKVYRVTVVHEVDAPEGFDPDRRTPGAMGRAIDPVSYYAFTKDSGIRTRRVSTTYRRVR